MILAYSRVSTAEQAADGATSLQEQERKIKALAQMRGVDLFEVISYVDAGVSGSIPLRERPGGKKMLSEAAPGDIICASKLDRIFRSASDALVTVERLAERKISLILIDMGVDPVNSNGTAKLFFSMLSAFAEFERGRIAERMTDGRRGKRQRNGHTGGSPPYGYRVLGKGREAKLEAIPEEQEVIKEAARLWESGVRPTEALKELHAKGYRTRKGGEFTITQIQRAVERVLVNG